jgi:hypothetical protein
MHIQFCKLAAIAALALTPGAVSAMATPKPDASPAALAAPMPALPPVAHPVAKPPPKLPPKGTGRPKDRLEPPPDSNTPDCLPRCFLRRVDCPTLYVSLPLSPHVQRVYLTRNIVSDNIVLTSLSLFDVPKRALAKIYSDIQPNFFLVPPKVWYFLSLLVFLSATRRGAETYNPSSRVPYHIKSISHIICCFLTFAMLFDICRHICYPITLSLP